MTAELKRRKKRKRRKNPFGCFGCFTFVLFTGILVYLTFGGGARSLMMYFYPLEFSGIVEKYSEEYDMDKYLIYAVIKNESNFNPQATSGADAKGLMQIMDDTAKDCVKKLKLDYDIPDDLFVPECNIQIGTYYLSQLIDVYEDTNLAVAAYNAGRGNVNKWLKDAELSDGKGGLLEIPFSETDRYLKKVMLTYDIYRWIYTDDDTDLSVGRILEKLQGIKIL